MPYSLKRTSDGMGDSGSMSMALWRSDSAQAIEGVEHELSARPRVGVAMRVGSIGGRSFSAQDWWQTTLITEILEESSEQTEDRDTVEVVRFKTGNSTYVWKKF
jgi:hypothetical protein